MATSYLRLTCYRNTSASGLETDRSGTDYVQSDGEVVHIDPEKGGYIVTVGDLDITSTAPSVDVYVPAEHEYRMDFGVGSEIVIAGRLAKPDDEPRLLNRMVGVILLLLLPPAVEEAMTMLPKIQGGMLGWPLGEATEVRLPPQESKARATPAPTNEIRC